jgi:hypothetical protein
MAREVWGTFSVQDHLRPHAFVAEVLLYDRLVIPTPPDEAERVRWIENGWEPDRLERVLEQLGELARPLPWNAWRQEQWADLRRATLGVDSESRLRATRMVLTEGLPAYVTGVEAVGNFPSIESMQAELELAPSTAVGPLHPMPGQTVCAVLGRELIVPASTERSDIDLLSSAVELAQDPDFIKKRRQFHRWQREFLTDGVTDAESVVKAVQEMEELLEEQKTLVRKRRYQVGLLFAFTVASVAVPMLGAPITAAAAGGAFLSVGQFVAGRWFDKADPSDARMVSAMFLDAQKRLGW